MAKDEDGWQDFLNLCKEQKEALAPLLDLFLTIEEKSVIAQRYLIIRSLIKGDLTQREIAKKFGVSIAQITRGSNALKIIGPKLKRILETTWDT